MRTSHATIPYLHDVFFTAKMGPILLYVVCKTS